MRIGSAWLFASVVVVLEGCSSGSSHGDLEPPDASADSSLDASADASDAPDAANDADAALPVVNGCGSPEFAANDHTASSDPRAITFATTASPVQFSPHCMAIKVGQTVTWSGDFTDHPLEPTTGEGNAIMDTTSGTTASFTFMVAGEFGFDCANHPAIMFGAILVTP